MSEELPRKVEGGADDFLSPDGLAKGWQDATYAAERGLALHVLASNQSGTHQFEGEIKSRVERIQPDLMALDVFATARDQAHPAAAKKLAKSLEVLLRDSHVIIAGTKIEPKNHGKFIHEFWERLEALPQQIADTIGVSLAEATHEQIGGIKNEMLLHFAHLHATHSGIQKHMYYQKKDERFEYATKMVTITHPHIISGAIAACFITAACWINSAQDTYEAGVAQQNIEIRAYNANPPTVEIGSAKVTKENGATYLDVQGLESVMGADGAVRYLVDGNQDLTSGKVVKTGSVLKEEKSDQNSYGAAMALSIIIAGVAALRSLTGWNVKDNGGICLDGLAETTFGGKTRANSYADMASELQKRGISFGEITTVTR